MSTLTTRPLTCVSCGKPFALNGELASVPDGNRVAFDPAHSRVWRICAACNEWNLLGAEASAAALPEVAARFAAAAPGGAPELSIALARVSDRLQLLRVGSGGLNDAEARAALALRGHVDKMAKARWIVTWVLAVAFAAWVFWLFSFSRGDRTLPPMMLLLYSSTWLLTQVGQKMAGRKVPNRSLAVTVAAIAAAVAAMLLLGAREQLQYVGFGLLVAGPLSMLLPLSSGHTVRVNNGRGSGSKVRLRDAVLTRLTLSWTQGCDDISVHELPGQRVLAGEEAAEALPGIIQLLYGAGLTQFATKMNPLMENGYALLTAVGGLGGLLNALDGYRRDNDGRVLLSELPHVYLAALELALTEPMAPRRGVVPVADQLRAAAAVAQDAEALEREALQPRTDTAPQP